MIDGRHEERGDRLRNALEKTVPSSEFSSDGTERELEQTPVMETPSPTAQQFLLKTKTNPFDTTDPEESSPITGFSTTSLVPPELLEEEAEEAGARFGVTGEAGRGGTAHVYRVVDRSLGRTIALKLLRGKAEGKKGIKQRFVHEARVTAMLEHPNIVPVYDIGVTDDNRVYFLMKNVTGVSLGDAIRAARDGRETPPEFAAVEGRLRVLLKVCDALAFAHDKGFIHQDIKPDNIMLGSFGEVLVLDWGCALGEKERSAGRVVTYGTPAYMSPEQARQEGADERSDVYCLGATLYHMITLCHPTWSNDPNEFWEMKRAGRLSPLPESVLASTPEALLAIARKAMAPDPDRRYQSVIAFQTALTEYQTHAESIALAQRAARQLQTVGESGEYHEYARITARFEQALEMWENNADAREGLVRVRRRHALRALERGDLVLAESIAADDDALTEVREVMEAERRRRGRARTRARRTVYAAAALGVLLLAASGYYVVDYFRYFGKWRRLYHVDFTAESPDLSGLAFSHMDITRDEELIEPTSAGLSLPNSNMFWARNVRERGDVRVEVVARWPEKVDGLEIMLNTRREEGANFAYCPIGYSCQFGGWKGVVNIISRNPRPQFPDQGNSVGCDLEAGRTYRLWFQRVGEELSLFVDGRCVFRIVEPLPLPGEGLEWTAVRSWSDVIIESFAVWRMGAPRKASPLIAGDAFVQRGQLRNAADVYLQTAQDHTGTTLEEQALTRAYLAASQVQGTDSVRSKVREIMRVSHPGSRYWPLLLQSDCLAAWRDGRYDEALGLGAQTLDRDPDSRIALQLIADRPDDTPVRALEGALDLLSRTTEVYGLSLERTGVGDISALEGLPIRSLALRRNNITDLSPLRGMPLRLLLISDNPIRDLSPLEETRLVSLEASGCKIRDIAPLADLPLRVLAIGHNEITDIGPLSGMPLSELNMEGNNIGSIEPLRGMRSLQVLDMDNNPVTDIAPLSGLLIRQLQLNGLPISSLSPLEGMPLEDLQIGRTRVTDLTPLSGMALTGLNLERTAVSSLEPLRGMPLRSLDISGTRVTDLSPLAGMELQSFTCERNEVRDVSWLRGMPLTNVKLSGNRVPDLSPLTGAPLRRLEVDGNPLRDIGPFRTAPPEVMVFDSVTAGPAYVESVLRKWERAGDTLTARYCRAAIAFRRGDGAGMRRTAATFQGHRYLYVPVALTFEQARDAARRFGGHLLTITSEVEFRFTHDLPQTELGVWLGLDVTLEPMRWLTEEPLVFENFHTHHDRSSPQPKYMLRGYMNDGCWFAASDSAMISDLIIEWD